MERELLLLGLLRQQEMHGYQLYEFIERDLAACTDLKKPTAYYLLNKLAERGWIAEELEQAGNRPQRRVYSLTPEGEAAFQRLLRENLASYQPSVFPGDVGLAFLDSLDTAEALRLLARRQEALRAALDAAQAAPVHGGSFQLVLSHQITHLQSELDWLEAAMVLISQTQSDHEGD